MKKIVIVLAMALMPFLASAVEINLTGVDQDGCEWKVSGEYNIWTGEFSVTVKNCHGDEYHIEGSGIANGGNNGGSTQFEDYQFQIQVVVGSQPTESNVRYIFNEIQQHMRQ